MITNSELLGLDLTLKDMEGRTGFQLAQLCHQADTINMIKRKMPSITDDLV